VSNEAKRRDEEEGRGEQREQRGKEEMSSHRIVFVDNRHPECEGGIRVRDNDVFRPWWEGSKGRGGERKAEMDLRKERMSTLKRQHLYLFETQQASTSTPAIASAPTR